MAVVMAERPAMTPLWRQAQGQGADQDQQQTWVSADGEDWVLWSQARGEVKLLLWTLHDWWIPRLHSNEDYGVSGPGLRLLIAKRADVAVALRQLIGSEEYQALLLWADHDGDNGIRDIAETLHRAPNTILRRVNVGIDTVTRLCFPRRYVGTQPPARN